MSIERPLTTEKKTFYKRGEFWGAVGAVLGTLAISAAYVEAFHQTDLQMRQDQALYDSLGGQDGPIAADGLTMSTAVNNSYSLRTIEGTNAGEGAIDLQVTDTCRINDVRINFVYSGQRVNDVTDYSFDTYPDGRIVREYNAHHHRDETYVQGTRVTHTFKNGGELVSGVFMNDIAMCALMAQQQLK